ncbi:MAG: hypothetical protein U0892_01985 [Pirellulales bacterium]
MRIRELPAACELIDEVEIACINGLAELGLHRSDAPQKIIHAIDVAILSAQASPEDQRTEEETVRLISLFGALWGEQLVRALRWSWVTLVVSNDQAPATTPSGTGVQAVCSTNRSLVIYPFFTLDAALRQNIDTAIELAFNILSDGKRVPNLPDGAFENVMEHVYHTPPRRTTSGR